MELLPLWLFPVILGAAALVIQGCNEDSATSVSDVNRKMFVSKEPVTTATGPLKVHPSNPRYFTDGSGKAIYLTGSHHWNNFLDSGEIGHPVSIFDYSRYLDFLMSHNHNLMRMRAWEGGINQNYVVLFPYARTGPGTALDGKPKFNLDQFNQAYFERLHSRVAAAQDRGVYVSIMLFNGWSIHDHGYGNPWPLHPFNGANNINGINGNPDGNGEREGREVHTLHLPAISGRQQA